MALPLPVEAQRRCAMVAGAYGNTQTAVQLLMGPNPSLDAAVNAAAVLCAASKVIVVVGFALREPRAYTRVCDLMDDLIGKGKSQRSRSALPEERSRMFTHMCT